MDRMISPDRALELVLKHVPSPRTASCPLNSALGRVLAESIVAPENVPRFVRAMMDGYAVALADAGSEVDVVGLVAAGHQGVRSVAPGRCVEIMTGAPCPEGTEAVVMVEHTERDGDRVKLPTSIKPGQHVQPIGDLCPRGTITLPPGTEITPLVVGHLAALNYAEVPVYALPKVAIISTGDELVPVESPLGEGQIRDSNGPMLVALSEELDVASVVLHHALDTEESLSETLKATDDADLVVLTGGVSMGKFDLVPRMVESMDATPIFHKITQKPGKPLLFVAGGQRLIFGLPGNARSTHFCFTRYVTPAIRTWMGRTPALHEGVGELASRYRCKSERTLFVPMRAEATARGGWFLHPFDEHGSADIYSTARANVYVRFDPGSHDNETGTQLPFFWMGPSHG
jgi:molybdenum cofactor synthesis domain-containing protein